jgi:SAM-dependent methyltransferase
MLTYLKLPPSLKSIYFPYRHRSFNLLDVGCGWNAAQKLLRYFPSCNYHGIDHAVSGNTDRDYGHMAKYYDLDLDQQSLASIPDGFFDVIIMSHVIEHLRKGLDIVAELPKKLKPGGVVYIETPALRSFSLPSVKRGCLHFHDDPTHIRLYSVVDIINTLLERDMKIVRAGTRRDVPRMALTPAMVLRALATGDQWCRAVWDWAGFAEYVFARKPLAPTN